MRHLTKLHSAIGILVFIGALAGIALLGNSNISATALVSIVGVGAVAGFQSTLASLIAGVRLRLAPMFRRGDYVTLSSGQAGTVEWMDAFAVRLRADDGTHVYAPVTTITTSVLIVGRPAPAPTSPEEKP